MDFNRANYPKSFDEKEVVDLISQLSNLLDSICLESEIYTNEMLEHDIRIGESKINEYYNLGEREWETFLDNTQEDFKFHINREKSNSQGPVLVTKSSEFSFNDLWELLSNQWKKVLASNLDLEGLFDRNDIDYLQTIKELDCSNSGITDLYPLYFMPQLEHLDISDTPIWDFTPIASLRNLKTLSATFCRIEDTQVFSGLYLLEFLDISYPKTHKVNMEGISQLANLKELYSNGCAVESLDFLYNLPQLKTLSVFFNYLNEAEILFFKLSNPNCWILK